VGGLVDYADDQRIGKTDPADHVDAYRKLRNTVRYLLGALAGLRRPPKAVDYAEMPPLERFILHRLWSSTARSAPPTRSTLPGRLPPCAASSAANDLSALYFDVRRDALYCDRPDAIRRRAARTVMDEAFERLTAWLAPLPPSPWKRPGPPASRTPAQLPCG
jgi:isoleucyl-tRNA synthetase